MENTKSVKSINKKNQIVKLNKKKIIIISIIIVSLLIGLSVGLYFAFRPARTPLVKNDHTHWVDVDKAKDGVKDSSKGGTEEDPNIVGVYFGVENGDLAELALYGNEYKDDEAKKDLAGPFSEYLEQNNDMNWYCINATNEEENRLNMEQFFHDGTIMEDSDDWAVHNSWQSTWYGGEASNSSLNFASEGNEWVSTDISFETESTSTTTDPTTGEPTSSTDTDDNNFQLVFTGEGEAISIDYTAPTWMWFRNGELYAVANGIVHTEDEDTGEITLPGEGDETGISANYWEDMYDYVYNQEIVQKP